MKKRDFIWSAAVGGLLGIALTLGLKSAMANAPNAQASATAETNPSVAFDEDCHIVDAIVATPTGLKHFTPTSDYATYNDSPVVAIIDKDASGNWKLTGAPSMTPVTCQAPGHLHFF